MGSTTNFELTFNQAEVRSDGAHTNATAQQPATGGGGGGTVNSVGAGTNVTITGTAINPIVNVPTIPYADVTGAPTSLPPNGSAGGDLAGTYPNPTLGAIGSSATEPSTAARVPVVTIDAKGRVTALTDEAINGVPYANITGTPSSLPPSGSAGGDLSGTYPNPTVAANAVTNAKLAQMAAYTLKGNNTASLANAIDFTEKQFRTMFFQKQLYIDDYVTAAGSTLSGINAAIADLNSNASGALVFGPGSYAINGTVTTITAPCEIKGCGLGVTTITQSSTTDDGFNLNTTNPCLVHDFTLTGPGSTLSSNAGINFGSTGTANSSSICHGVQVNGWNCGVMGVQTTNGFVIRDSTIGGNVNGIVIGASLVSGTVTDSADSTAMIVNCTCNNTAVAILLRWAEGMYIGGNQLVGSPIAIRHDFHNVSSKSDLYIIGNHIENASTQGILLNYANLTGGNQFSNILITGNEFAETPVGVSTSTGTSGGPQITFLSVVGNVMTLSATPVCGVKIFGCFGVVIDGNTFNQNAGSNLSITVDSSCTQVTVGHANNYTGGGAWTIASLTSNLPAASCPGSRLYVTNGVASPTWGATISATGAAWQPTFCDGSNWRYG